MSELSMITLNLHCLEEENIDKNQEIIVNEIITRNVDIIFLQEVAQFSNSPVIFGDIKESNYGYQLYLLLQEKGYHYEYIYTPIKFSFNKYDEGLGILSRYPLRHMEFDYISNTTDYNDWLSRKYLKATILVEGIEIDLITAHLGWDSENEKYIDQCKRLVNAITNDHTIIGGDFNVAFGSDYYSQTTMLGIVDLYSLNKKFDNNVTFENTLDVHKKSARIDYIYALHKYNVLEQQIIFKNPMVSDHFGIYMKIEV